MPRSQTFSLITNIYHNVSIEFRLLDLVTAFVIAYFQYRLWYSTPLGCDTSSQPALNTVRDIGKFMTVIGASSWSMSQSMSRILMLSSVLTYTSNLGNES